MTDTQNPQSPGFPPTPSEGSSPTPSLQPAPPSGTALKKAIIAVGVLLIAGLLGAAIYFLPRLSATKGTPQPPATQLNLPSEPTPSVIATPEATSTPSDVATSTASTTTAPLTSTTTQPEPEGVTFQTKIAFGQEVQMFEGDIVTVNDAARSYRIKAVEFTDSRCPEGVQCVWAGERGVRLEVTDLLKDKIEDMRLGMTTAKTLEVMGLRGTLIEIEDGKGGPYATIRFE